MFGYLTQFPPKNNLWRIKNNTSFSFRIWESECIIYNHLSGHTHLLDTLAAEILFTLQEHTLHTDELIAQLKSKIKIPVDIELKHYLNKLLPELQRAELLE